jgi:hypothetical protein
MVLDSSGSCDGERRMDWSLTILDGVDVIAYGMLRKVTALVEIMYGYLCHAAPWTLTKMSRQSDWVDSCRS